MRLQSIGVRGAVYQLEGWCFNKGLGRKKATKGEKLAILVSHLNKEAEYKIA